MMNKELMNGDGRKEADQAPRKGEDLRARTQRFALRILSLIEQLPPSTTGRIIANQLGRCGTSVGANYRAACRGRSQAEFVAKLGVVVEEADEAAYWLEIIKASSLLDSAEVRDLHREAVERVKIMVASRGTARRTAHGHSSSIPPFTNRNSPLP